MNLILPFVFRRFARGTRVASYGKTTQWLPDASKIPITMRLAAEARTKTRGFGFLPAA
ncbi:MAG: hypothetical protein ACOY0T_34700 [Myxococcota bacterium]